MLPEYLDEAVYLEDIIALAVCLLLLAWLIGPRALYRVMSGRDPVTPDETAEFIRKTTTKMRK